MKKDDQEILKEVQKNTGMAMKAIHTIADKVYDKKMKYELAKEGRKYSPLRGFSFFFKNEKSGII